VAHADSATVVLIVAFFIVAGSRDEPQAEPWWWPRAPGLTGAERRNAARANSEPTIPPGP
ncbi:MAG: hypothetical protein IAI49_10205, partial [Candidatus Eremiobacteraeota bacterium]|nr:hypothetical protein [Candidatus Eremiobacteraeota bacterium]